MFACKVGSNSAANTTAVLGIDQRDLGRHGRSVKDLVQRALEVLSEVGILVEQTAVDADNDLLGLGQQLALLDQSRDTNSRKTRCTS